MKKYFNPGNRILSVILTVVFFYLTYYYLGTKKNYVPKLVFVIALLVLGILCMVIKKSIRSRLLLIPAVSFMSVSLMILGSPLFKKKFSLSAPSSFVWILGIIFGSIVFLTLLVAEYKSVYYRMAKGCIFAGLADIIFRWTYLAAYTKQDGAAMFKNLFLYDSKFFGVLSLLTVCALYLILTGIFGIGAGNVIYTVAWILIFIANCVRMYFHNSFFKPLDIYQFGDFIRILPSFMKPGYVVLLIIVCVAIVFFCVRFRKAVCDYLKPVRSSVGMVLGLCIMMCILSGLYENEYTDQKIDRYDAWTGDAEKVKDQGYPAFFYIYYIRMSEWFPKMGEASDAEQIRQILLPFADTHTETAVKAADPDVVMIMLESVMDVDLLSDYGVVMSEDPDGFIDSHTITETVSPTYGGLTAEAEFEALTGMTDSIYPDGTVEYTTFFTNGTEHVYSMIDAFERHGYITTAIHQNTPDFFNRGIVYESLGFDKFITNRDFELKDEYFNKDRIMRNDHFRMLVEQQLSASDEPQFIWGITIESHSPYDEKYDSLDIHASCDALSGSEMAQLDGYLQSVKNTDIMLEELTEYLKSRKKPTILIAFGDHWPALESNYTLNMWDDVRRVVNTPCIGIYVDEEGQVSDLTGLPDHISMNYLPEYILHTAGINDQPFYNYLCALRQKMPVCHVHYRDEAYDGLMEEYKTLQNDILFESGFAGKEDILDVSE